MSDRVPSRTGTEPSQPAALLSARQSLDALGTALESCDLHGLAACAPGIEATARELRRVDARRLAGAPDAARQLDAVMSALARCRRLGASLADALRLAGAAHAAGEAHTYGPRGDAPMLAAQRATGRAVDAHV